MSQENEENYSENESGAGEREQQLNPEELAVEVARQNDSQQIDDLPTEAIGSYARIEAEATDEDSEETSNPTAQS